MKYREYSDRERERERISEEEFRKEENIPGG